MYTVYECTNIMYTVFDDIYIDDTVSKVQPSKVFASIRVFTEIVPTLEWRMTLVSSVGIALRAHTVTNWRLQCGGGPALICAVCRVNPARSLSLSSSHLAQPTDNSAPDTQ